MQREYKQNIESLLRAYYIRYNRLYELNNVIAKTTTIKNQDHVDIYIDLYNMLKSIYTIDVYANNTLSICASVINLAAHLRGYYITRHRLWTRIFLVYADDSNNNHRQFLPEFGMDTVDETLKYNETSEFITSQLKLVKILCAYINEVYFVERKSDFGAFTYNNILKNQNTISIILSKSKYLYQIPALLKNVYILRPKKITYEGTSSDESYIVYYNTALTSTYIKSSSVEDILININPSMLSLFLTLNGCQDKKVPALINISRTSKAIYSALKANKIINGYNSDTKYVYGNLIIPNNLTFIDYPNFDYRFKAIDIAYQNIIYKSQVESKDNTWFIDLHDPDTVKAINNQYFVNNPLDLNNL